MGNICNQTHEKCPEHSEQSIQYICIHDRCIEPLCQKCLPTHYQQHKDVGLPPNIQKLDYIKSKLLKSIKNEASVYEQTENTNQAVKQIYPAQYIKQLTRQYFLRKRSSLNIQNDIPLSDLLSNIQTSHALMNNPTARQLHWSFLKQNTVGNQGVLSFEYSHLY